MYVIDNTKLSNMYVCMDHKWKMFHDDMKLLSMRKYICASFTANSVRKKRQNLV